MSLEKLPWTRLLCLVSGLRVTPCDVNEEGQAGDTAVRPSGFLATPGHRGAGSIAEQGVLPAVSACAWRQGLGL